MASVSGAGASFSVQSVGGTWSWMVRSANIQGGGVFYEVVDLSTPWGPLIQSAIPIPGEVILEVAQSVIDLQQQFAPLLSLVQPAQVSFSLIVTEGDPAILAASVPVTNLGAFGSFMTVSGTPNVPWLRVDPSSVGGIEKNEQATLEVTLLPASLLVTSSPYSGVVNLQDNRTPSTLISLSFIVTVFPRPTIGFSPSDITFIYYQSTGAFTGPFTLTVDNSGPVDSTLNWTAAKLMNTSDWMSFTPLSGGPLASGETSDITLSFVPSAVPQILGTYTDKLRISSSNASNSPVDVPVNLIVTA